MRVIMDTMEVDMGMEANRMGLSCSSRRAVISLSKEVIRFMRLLWVHRLRKGIISFGKG
jgi:hypothetical protein